MMSFLGAYDNCKQFLKIIHNGDTYATGAMITK